MDNQLINRDKLYSVMNTKKSNKSKPKHAQIRTQILYYAFEFLFNFFVPLQMMENWEKCALIA